VVVAALHICAAASEQLNRGVPLPGNSIPADEHIVITFGFFVIAGMLAPLRAEGQAFDFKTACSSFVSAYFLLHSDEEKTSIYRKGSDAFRAIARADAPNVAKWKTSIDHAKPPFGRRVTSWDLFHLPK
jgi:hypothetical protein